MFGKQWIKKVEKPTSAAPLSGQTRTAKLREIMVEMGKEGNPDNFSGGGVPKVAAVQKAVGFEISAKERSNVWMDIVSSGELN